MLEWLRCETEQPVDDRAQVGRNQRSTSTTRFTARTRQLYCYTLAVTPRLLAHVQFARAARFATVALDVATLTWPPAIRPRLGAGEEMVRQRCGCGREHRRGLVAADKRTHRDEQGQHKQRVFHG